MDNTRDIIEKLTHNDVDDATEELPQSVWCPVWGYMCGLQAVNDGGNPGIGIRSHMDLAARDGIHRDILPLIWR
jgi:hypothetical protein